MRSFPIFRRELHVSDLNQTGRDAGNRIHDQKGPIRAGYDPGPIPQRGWNQKTKRNHAEVLGIALGNVSREKVLSFSFALHFTEPILENLWNSSLRDVSGQFSEAWISVQAVLDGM